MPDYLSQLISKYRRKGLLIDTNLLLLLVVGSYDRDLIGGFKRTVTFTAKEFDLLLRFANQFSTIVTTPHILTETSNFIHQLRGMHRTRVGIVLRSLVEHAQEKHESARTLVAKDDFLRFGLTDTAIIDIAPEQHLVLTDDLPLVHLLQNRGIDAINFNHLRTLTG